MSKPDIYWTGESGTKYGYWVYPIEAQFRKIAGNVIFAKQTEAGEWVRKLDRIITSHKKKPYLSILVFNETGDG